MLRFLTKALLIAVWDYVHLFEEAGAGFFVFRWFVTCVLCVIVCLLFILMSLLGICSLIVALIRYFLYYFTKLIVN